MYKNSFLILKISLKIKFKYSNIFILFNLVVTFYIYFIYHHFALSKVFILKFI
jgi:hypothetical protein